MAESSRFSTTLFTRSLLLLGACVLVMGVSLSVAEETVPKGTVVGQPAEGGQGTKSERLREGTKIVDQVGYFLTTGGSPKFYANDGKDQFEGLENLNLERISRTLGENPDRLMWSISGMITEYQGSNYLLIERAVLKTKNVRRSGNQPTGQANVD